MMHTIAFILAVSSTAIPGSAESDEAAQAEVWTERELEVCAERSAAYLRAANTFDCGVQQAPAATEPSEPPRSVILDAEEMVTPDMLRQYNKDGYLLVEGLLSEHEADSLRERVQQLVKNCNHTRCESHGPGIGLRLWDLFTYGEEFVAVMESPEISALLDLAMGGAEYVLSSFTAVVLPPNFTATGLHVDWPLYDIPTPRPVETVTCNLVFYLQDTSAKNGATRILPGMHASPMTL